MKPREKSCIKSHALVYLDKSIVCHGVMVVEHWDREDQGNPCLSSKLNPLFLLNNGSFLATRSVMKFFDAVVSIDWNFPRTVS